MQTPCSQNVPKLIEKVTSTVSEMCTAGVQKMIGGANSTLQGAATKAGELILQGGVQCATMASSLPSQLSQPVAEACNNASQILAPMPTEVIQDAMAAAEKLAGGICTAIGGNTLPAPPGAAAAAAAQKAVKAYLKIRSTEEMLALRADDDAVQLLSTELVEATGNDLTSEVVKAITDAKDQLTGVAKEAMAKGIATVAKTLASVLMEGLIPLKTELKTKADGLATTATGGLEKLTAAIVTIPTKVKELLTNLCGMLPSEDLKTLCNTKGAEILEAATKMLGDMCSSGVKKLTGLAVTGCAKASALTDGVLASAGQKCTDMMTSLPEDLAEAKEPLGECCTSVTQNLTGIVGEVCDSVTSKLNTSLEESCQKIGASGAAAPPARRLLSHMVDMLEPSELRSRLNMLNKLESSQLQAKLATSASLYAPS